MKKYLRFPTRPIDIEKNLTFSSLLSAMANAGFQGKNLGKALKIWQKMCEEKTIIFLGLAGAMVPAGLRKVIVFLIKNRLIDCLVSTGANLYHDIHESLGYKHYQGSPDLDDNELRELGLDRIYDVLAKEEEFRQTDLWITNWTKDLKKNKISTREYLFKLGKDLKSNCSEEGILTSCATSGVPIYCPAIVDSAIGISVFDARIKGKKIYFDLIKDVEETGEIVKKSPQTGVIYLGGGVPKNFIQQAALVPAFVIFDDYSHKYAIQITQDSPQWGGLSGCTLEEGKSWGKISKDAQKVNVNCDITIALPILVAGLKEINLKRKYLPKFRWGKDGVDIDFKSHAEKGE